ncbi:MAG: Flp pilus assembly complex ATPase component TadA [Methylomonas sp.]|jgi:type II secretory ATPase GspE/PulE/Tfp pilus assembly ATPase PilB-like protein/DNA-binding NarL/FixJ family response regulator|uniref:ATPase, T2SS/T4P/T4SS family n=1 Tax=Methylomonas sp. TaxID=418 RepID=UPI0025E44ACA|nr:ATPase, T2SS/T4P/T4SS family [Methylomonas sp.]MCK9607910.1 Flp pilus assembly complex ATPase component TadA [Methylomonas sp.]
MSKYSSLFTGGHPDSDSAGKHNYRLLFVDDEANVLSALRRIFRRENYRIDTAMSGQEALQLLKDNAYQLIITDYKMPHMNGAELLKRIKALHPDTIRIMLTGQADTGAVMGAINDGAVYKFILKPWNDDDLRITVSLALEQYDLINKNKKLNIENQEKTKEIGKLRKAVGSDGGQIAILLNKKNLLNNTQLQEVFKLKQNADDSVLKLILDRQWLDEAVIRDILRKDLLVEEIAPAEFQVEPEVRNLIPHSICRQHAVLPLKIENGQLLVAMADPVNLDLQTELSFMSGLPLKVVMANVAEIQRKVEDTYGGMPSFSDFNAIVATEDPFENIQIVIDEEDTNLSLGQLLKQTEEPPAIRLVNAVILEAIRLGASDIHIQPRAKSVAVRYRIDGILEDRIYIPHHFHGPLVSRIKVMAAMDIAERRRPQDGRVTIKTPNRIIDLRISTLPVLNGEKLVMRILDQNASIHPIDQLGFSTCDLVKLERLINKPQGIILATGPTGSGKTSTLYSLLQHSATPSKNFVTLEEPVEYYLDTAGQVNLKGKIDLTFPAVLRAVLKQDPDVILLGEIRDLETAEIAFQAALTGHLVFSTLHGNSAIATIARLFDIGLKPYSIASSLAGVISQRLVRKICPYCRTPTQVDPNLLEQLGPLFSNLNQPLFKGQGCEHCSSSGYHGRICLIELLIPNEELRDMIARQAGHLEFKNAALKNGYKTVADDALSKVLQGLTTCEEILRVLGPQDI